MFDRLELLELFDDEKITDTDTGATDYLLTKNDFSIIFTVWPIYKTVFLQLSYKKQNFFVYELTLNNIETIKVDRENPERVTLLMFDKTTGKTVATLMLKPEISLQCECNKDNSCLKS